MVHWGGWPDGPVNQRTPVLVSIMQRKPNNTALEMGSAVATVGQILRYDDNTIRCSLHVSRTRASSSDYRSQFSASSETAGRGHGRSRRKTGQRFVSDTSRNGDAIRSCERNYIYLSSLCPIAQRCV